MPKPATNKRQSAARSSRLRAASAVALLAGKARYPIARTARRISDSRDPLRVPAHAGTMVRVVDLHRQHARQPRHLLLVEPDARRAGDPLQQQVRFQRARRPRARGRAAPRADRRCRDRPPPASPSWRARKRCGRGSRTRTRRRRWSAPPTGSQRSTSGVTSRRPRRSGACPRNRQPAVETGHRILYWHRCVPGGRVFESRLGVPHPVQYRGGVGPIDLDQCRGQVPGCGANAGLRCVPRRNRMISAPSKAQAASE